MNKKDAKIIEDAERDGIPIFVITAKDVCSVEALENYYVDCASEGCSKEHLAGINERTDEFKEWQMNNPDKVHLPD